MDRETKSVATRARRKTAAARKSPVAPLASALADAHAQQAATSEILHVISQVRDDVQPVFDTIARSALTLCRASSSIVVILNAGVLSIGALASTTQAGADFLRTIFPRAPSRDNGATRAVLTRQVVVIPDILEDTEYATTETALRSGFRSVLAVPLMHEGAPIGAISLGRNVPGPFPPSHIELLQTFAAQAVIALENVRLLTELGKRNAALSESLEQRTVTSEILGVISQSPTNVQPAFDTIAENALRLCGGIFSAVYRYDGELIHLGALRNISPQGDAAFQRAYPCKPSRNGTTQRAILTGHMVHMPDVLLDAEYGYHDIARAAGFRSVLSIPMLHAGAPIGTITVYRDVAGVFPDEKIALLRTFADQAVIAVQNVRLFTEVEARNHDLSEALKQQTATSDILRVISRSQTDVQPVFDTIAENALRLCDATFSAIYRFDGEFIHVAAHHNLNPEGAPAFFNAFPARPGQGGATHRAVLTAGIVQFADVLADPEYEYRDAAKSADFRSALSVPMLRDGAPIGTITVYRDVARPFPDVQIELLKTFADQAVIAVENVRLFKELEARTAQLTRSVGELRALGEVGQAVSSTLDLGTVLSTIVARAPAERRRRRIDLRI